MLKWDKMHNAFKIIEPTLVAAFLQCQHLDSYPELLIWNVKHTKEESGPQMSPPPISWHPKICLFHK